MWTLISSVEVFAMCHGFLCSPPPLPSRKAPPPLETFLYTCPAVSELQVTPDQLMTALTTRAIETMGERIVKRLDAAAASVSRDALAKNLYAKLFDWLVAAINRKISAIGVHPFRWLASLVSHTPLACWTGRRSPLNAQNG